MEGPGGAGRGEPERGEPGRESGAAEPRAFSFEHQVEVRFRDLDPMGHAHHTLPLIYFEEARAAYWRHLVGRRDLAAIDYILAGVQVTFHARIHYPQRARVRLRVSRLGGRSFDLEYELRGEGGELLAEGTSVQVMYDYAAAASKPIPAEIRERIEAHDGQISAVSPTSTDPTKAPSR